VSASGATASAWAGELAALNERLARAARGLAALGTPAVGETPRDEVWRDGHVALWRYRSRARPAAQPPLLVVYALVNRPYVLDLQPDRSLVRGLLDLGLDVYLLDWGYATPADRFTTLADLVCGHVDRAVRHVAAEHGAVDLLGVCQGGTLALCYAALEPARIRRLVTMVTPVDFHTPDNLLAKWARGLDVDRLVATVGNVPGEYLNAAFLALLPFRLTLAKYVALADDADDPVALANFLRMEQWIFDSPDQPGEAFREFVDAFYRRNALAAGTFSLAGRAVELARVTMPVLNVYATRDHLVPPSASRTLGRLVGSRRYAEHAVEGGHIGIYVSARARDVPARLAAWLGER
jgi:polyhydroxyalkanoate synthase